MKGDGESLKAQWESELSPYRYFCRDEWAKLRMSLTAAQSGLTEGELEAVRGLNEYVSLGEVEEVYLPLSRLLSFYVSASQQLFRVTGDFLGSDADQKRPFIIGVAGSVAVGKSTLSRVLRLLLHRWPGHPKVDLVPTDGFLLPNAELERQGLLERKGFPESYDIRALLGFLDDVKSGRDGVRTPMYSHLRYDIVPESWIEIDHPDILIMEGLNVLQPSYLPKDGKAIPFVSDYFDFSIYLHAEEERIRVWYRDRFMRLRETAFCDPQSYFHDYSFLTETEAMEKANDIWDRINLPNLQENILPTRQRASLILSKGEDHRVEEVMLRKL